MNRQNGIALTRAHGLGALPTMLEKRLGTHALMAVFEQEDVPIVVIEDRQTLLPMSAMMAIFARAGHKLGDRTFGFQVGERMSHAGYGLWIEHAVQAPTLGEALQRMVGNLDKHTIGSRAEIGASGNHIVWRYVAGRILSANHQHSDHIIQPLISLVRQYLGSSWQPDWIELNYERDADAHLLEEYLQTPIHFARDSIGVAVRKADLHQCRKAPLAPGARLITLREVAADIVLKDAPEPARSLSALVAMRLLDGKTDIETTAQMAGLSVRALQRRLRQKGYTYREIVEAARMKRAAALLIETPASIIEIAFMLGYQDHASFTRAFNRWAGCPPNRFRSFHRSQALAAE